MSEDAYQPDAGHLVWTDFDPTLGREQAGRRPALVVSPAAFALNTGFVIVCPITSRIRPFPTSVVLPEGLPVNGEILLSNLRSIDTRARVIRYAGAKVPSETAQARPRQAQRSYHHLTPANRYASSSDIVLREIKRRGDAFPDSANATHKTRD